MRDNYSLFLVALVPLLYLHKSGDRFKPSKMQLYFLSVLLSSLAYAQEYVLQSSFAGGPTFLDNFEFW